MTSEIMRDDLSLKVIGLLKITDADTGEVLIDKTNSINFETMSYALALSLTHRPNGTIAQLCFGNGASSVSAFGGVTYLQPNVTGLDAQLYNQTYQKFVDDLSPLNVDPVNNYMRVNHVVGNTYSDIIVSCLLDTDEPSGQDPVSESPDNNAAFIFDEIGIKTYDATTTTGMMLTHVIFHPVQKAADRRIEIVYTLRVVLS